MALVGLILALPLAYVVVKFAYQIIYYRFLHPLRQFPGPFWASVTRLWITYHNVKGDEPTTFQELHRRYGPVIRVTPTMLLVNDATKLPDIYNRQANKSQHYITGSFGKTESLFNMQDSKQHAYFRKIAAGPCKPPPPLLLALASHHATRKTDSDAKDSFSNVKKMEPLIDARITDWIAKLNERFAETGQQMDFAPWAVFVAYDIISEVGFGEPFGFIKQGTDVSGLIQGFHDGLVISPAR